MVLLVAMSSRPAATDMAWSIVAIAIVAVVLDGVDGWVARRTGTASAFGMRFDMETDAALILVLAILAWRYGKAGPWILRRRSAALRVRRGRVGVAVDGAARWRRRCAAD